VKHAASGWGIAIRTTEGHGLLSLLLVVSVVERIGFGLSPGSTDLQACDLE
jgi:hypothetical protein